MAFVKTFIVVTAIAWLVGGCADLAQQDSPPMPTTTHEANKAATVENASEDAQRRVGRYTTALAAPVSEASDPLGVYARIAYPRQTVRTVGEAIEHTLLRTGWRLKDRFTFEPAAAHYMTLPLPESQRVLGPYPVRTILRILADGSWQWHEDPVRRVTWFTLTAIAPPVAQPAVTPAHPGPDELAKPATPVAVQTSEVESTPLAPAKDQNVSGDSEALAQEALSPASANPDCECD